MGAELHVRKWMTSKRSQEAYVLIDHRNSPGITHEYLAKTGIKNAPVVGAGQTFESAVVVCHGCQGDIILNPGRTRERAWCRQHDAYLCDNCDARRTVSGICKPLTQMMEELFNKLSKSVAV
jgi:hypothetical protein